MSDDTRWQRDYEQGRLVMPDAGARSYADARKAERDMPVEVAKLRAENDRLRSWLKDIAEHDCAYGDGCPAFGARHGRCVGCIARAALDAQTEGGK